MPEPFAYSNAPVPIRPDIRETHQRAWERLANPGAWWTGAERVEIAAEVRNAWDCALCAERKQAVSPFSVDGEHTHTASLISPLALDAVHRIVTDASRLTQSWLEKNAAAGLSDGHYVELLGLVVAVLSIDELHRGLGIAPEPLPEPRAGEPSRERPAELDSGISWVPMLSHGAAKKQGIDIYAGIPQAPNVVAAMSLVPDAVRQLRELSAAHYIPAERMMLAWGADRTLERSQIELIAGRVSKLNDCFY